MLNSEIAFRDALDAYRLHFTAEVIGGAEDRRPILVPDETGYGQPLAAGVARVYDIPVASADVSGLRLSVVETPKDSRAKNIRFHPRW